eukprot:scaffold76361_cov17-Tisochrysis_lutea.AAC.1
MHQVLMLHQAQGAARLLKKKRARLLRASLSCVGLTMKLSTRGCLLLLPTWLLLSALLASTWSLADLFGFRGLSNAPQTPPSFVLCSQHCLTPAFSAMTGGKSFQ